MTALTMTRQILAVAFGLFLCASGAAAANEHARVIRTVTVEGLRSITIPELLDLLDLKEGRPLDPRSVRAGIKRAFIKGLFEDIQVHAEGEEQAAVRVVVVEKDVVRRIRVTGNSAVSDRAVKAGLMLREGEIMRYDLLDEATEKLRALFAERGFPAAGVTISTDRPRPGAVDITVAVSEGTPVLVREIVIRGVPPDSVKWLVAVHEGDVYDRSAIRRDEEDIAAYFRDQGYLRPSVTHLFSDGVLMIEVQKGKKAAVVFEGNEAVSSRRLIREVPFSEAGEIRDDLIEEAGRRIISLYRSLGYPFAMVAPVLTRPDGEKGEMLEVHFFVHEGERVSVGRIAFSGVTFPEQNLKEIMSLREGSPYNPDLLYPDTEVLREFYNALGFLSAVMKEPEVRIEAGQAVIAIEVREGPRTLVEGIDIIGAEALPAVELRRVIAIETGVPYNEVDIADARYRLIETYLDQGFVDVTVHVRVEFGAQGARVTFEIIEGRKTLFGKTIVTGNARTRSEVIEREFLHREGMPFSHGLLTRGRQRLYKLGLFTEVGIEGLDRADGKRDVHVRVTEGNAGAVELGIGYGDYERYRGFADLSYRNLFGMNRQVSLRLEMSSIEERYILTYYEPWLMGRPTPFRALLLREERTEKNIDTGEVSYRLRRHTATAGIERKLNPSIKGELYYRFSFVKTFDVKPDVILTKEDTGTLAISGVRAGLIYDTRDNPFDPRSGVLAGVTLDVASALLLSETDFAKAVFNGSIYQELSKTFVLAASFRVGVAQGFGSTRELPLVERFFLGGRNTVRGYEQDTLGPKGSDGTPTGGNAFLLGNLELRTDLGKGIGLVTFIDAGNVWVNTGEIDGTLKYTAGIGLRYTTPVGPLRIDYGHKLRKEEGLSTGEIHFSIGHAF